MPTPVTSPNPYERVKAVLDAAIGGPEANINAHGAFWRNLSRSAFVQKKLFGFDLVRVGDGRGSMLVKALKGEAPFGADLATPPPGSVYARMPDGMLPVPGTDIAFIEKWIDNGCPETAHSWRSTSAPKASSRYDDVWFHDGKLGWAVNSNGQILHTDDGGASWKEQLHDRDAYMRCVAFASATRGWVGLVAAAVPGKVLYETFDGGETWSLVTNLPDGAPAAVCGMWVVNEQVVYIAGTNRPEQPARMMKTVDGGKTWNAWDMRSYAHNLIDVYFTSPDTGWVVGGRTDDVADPAPIKKNLRPVVLFTEDGGRTWSDQIFSIRNTFPLGEWGWKIDFVDSSIGFISLQNYDEGAILATVDGGNTWMRRPINDSQSNANLEGIGFVDGSRGWVGGWGDRPKKKRTSSETFDGGSTWRDANQIGRTINRFRFIRQGSTLVGYAAGETIYKYTDEPNPLFDELSDASRLLSGTQIQETPGSLTLRFRVPRGAKRLTVRIWDPDGPLVRTLVDESSPLSGNRVLEWDRADDAGKRCGSYSHVLRISVDGASESRLV